MKNQNTNYHIFARQFSALFLAIQTNCMGGQWSQEVVKKKRKRKTASIFETLESFETEHYFLALTVTLTIILDDNKQCF